jgi:predicted nucleotidyltransferase
MNSTIEHYRKVLRATLPELAASYQVTALGLFGSRLRGDQRPDSDLDVLVNFDEPPSLLRLIELEQRLGDLLGVKVDLVIQGDLKPHIGRKVLAELAPV